MITVNELKKLARKVDAHIDAAQTARIAQLRGIERDLFAKLIRELVNKMSTDNGIITSKGKEVTFSQAIDRIFKAVKESGMAKFAAESIHDMAGVLDLNADYYAVIHGSESKGRKFNAIKARVNKNMKERLGVGDNNKPVQSGYLERQLGGIDAVREQVKTTVFKAVKAGRPMKDLHDELSNIITGTENTDGEVVKKMRGYVFDNYQRFDRDTNKEFATRLALKYFVYSGGLIETSRDFCVKRNNKVFTTEEADKWKDDATLPKTAAERDSGVVTDYNPLEDCGRWNCRHRLLYMPKNMAERLRPDLKSK